MGSPARRATLSPMPPEEHITVNELVDAYWQHYESAHGSPHDSDRAKALFWAWEMTESIAVGAGWIDNDVHMTRDAVRVAPAVERLDLLARGARAASEK